MGHMDLRPAVILMAALWIVYFLGFLANHWRVERRRRTRPDPPRRVLVARASDAGLLLETIAVTLLWLFRRPQPQGVPAALVVAALLLAALSTAFAWTALRHLGRQWRLRAVVTDDHELVTTGPYACVRHPIYASLLGMLATNGILLARWWALAASLAVFVAGTEIRVRAEDGILARQFPTRFPAYRDRVPAYLPFLR